MPQREIKYQRETDLTWGRRVADQPGCEALYACTQCGNCSGACPLSIYMDVTPRRMMALVREGFRAEALRSQTIWLCTCCYVCSVECPQQINVADVMFALKREAIESKIAPKRFPVPVLAQQFLRMVRTHGRTAEFWLTVRMVVRTDPLALFRMMRLAWRLRRTGRLPVRPKNMERLASFHGDMGLVEEKQ